jgi:hypothetical protein
VTAHDIPAPPTLDESREKIISFLKKASGAKLLERWVAELREYGDVTIHDH